MSAVKGKSLFQDLTDDQKNWLSRALVNMIIIDKSIDPNEIAFLEKALAMLSPQEIVRIVKNKLPNKDFTLEDLRQDCNFATHTAMKCLFFLGWSAIADASFKEKEVKLMMIAGLCMRIHEAMITDIINIFSRLSSLLATHVARDRKNDTRGWMDCLSEEQRTFLGKGIFAMVLSDNKVDPGELEYVGQAVTLLGGAEVKAQLMTYVKTCKDILRGDSPHIEIAPEYAVRIMYFLGYIGISDDNLDKTEQKIMLIIGSKMGLSAPIIREIFDLFNKLQKLLKNYTINSGYPAITIDKLFRELSQ